ncbi:MAG TPA: cytochrome oxidase assembly protein, partial [Candidatus Entotheonella sp.]
MVGGAHPTEMQIENCNLETLRWPHRWAVALACATFPLVWVGGLVTTTDSGMAVPDWPTTYGYNLFLYPLSTWLAGPWDIFVEHGHRLLGAIVGCLTIGLVVSLWRSESRTWLRWLGVAALLLVVSQGVLGGMRVVYDERSLAMFHGTTGPLFFAITVAMTVFTSRRWR